MALSGSQEPAVDRTGQQGPLLTASKESGASQAALTAGKDTDAVVEQPAGQPRKQGASEGSPLAGAVPPQPSTPSEESNEPARRSSRGARLKAVEPAESHKPAGRGRAAKRQLQPAAPQPKASRAKPGRGRRPKADPQALQSAAGPQRARPSRASAVAAAGFLAKVINAEVDNEEASEEEEDLGYQADFRRAAKRKSVEDPQANGRSARLQAKRAPVAEGDRPAGSGQPAQAVPSGHVITRLTPQQVTQAGGVDESAADVLGAAPPASSPSSAQAPVAMLPAAVVPSAGPSALPEALQQGQMAAKPQHQPQPQPQPAAQPVAEPPAAVQPPAALLPVPHPQATAVVAQPPVQPKAGSKSEALPPAVPQAISVSQSPPMDGQPAAVQAAVVVPPASAGPPAALPVLPNGATHALPPQQGQPLPPPKLYPMPIVLQRPLQAAAASQLPAPAAGMLPVTMPPCSIGAASTAAAEPAPGAAAVAPAQPEKRKRRKYRRRRFAGHGESDLDDDDLFDEDDLLPVALPPPPPPETDDLFGCSKCRYAKNGCTVCRERPIFSRPKQRWKPQQGRPQDGIQPAPVFHPTEEEFKDPLAYINSCRPEGERCGIVCIVPPPSFRPPFALERGTNGQSADSFKFAIRKQLTSHLCMRAANKPAERRATRRGYGATTHKEGEADDEFGFVTMEKRHTLRSFAAYADWAKAMHFSDPPPKPKPEDLHCKQTPKRRKVHTYSGPEPSVADIEAEFWRIVETPDDVYESLYGQDLDSGHHGSGFPLPPFRAALLREHLAGQESHARELARKTLVPAAEARAALLKEKQQEIGSGIAMAAGASTPAGGAASSKQDEANSDGDYATHPWNINNLPRNRGSTLRYLAGNELITGVQVPWLYVGSVLSAFCWHIEDHALYSVNYHHLGAPKVWYGVPAHASEALEEAMADALPHLFDAAPNLIYQLVTMVSPKQLAARGVPVYRLVHEEGSFVVTFPNAFHSGFNTGFNCAEAVNFGPPDWLPYGTDRAQKYRGDIKPLTLSHDALLVTLVTSAPAAAEAARARGEDLAAAPLPPDSVAAAGVPFSEAELQAVDACGGVDSQPVVVQAAAASPAEAAVAPEAAVSAPSAAPASMPAPSTSAAAAEEAAQLIDCDAAAAAAGAEPQPAPAATTSTETAAAADELGPSAQQTAPAVQPAEATAQQPPEPPTAEASAAEQPADAPSAQQNTPARQLLDAAAAQPAITTADAGAMAADAAAAAPTAGGDSSDAAAEGRARRPRREDPTQRWAASDGSGDSLVGGLLGQLDPVSTADAPAEGIRLAAGELTIRAAEERRRIKAGSQAGPLLQVRMTGPPGALGGDGCHTDTTEVDCEVCKTDLWLSAVVTPLAPGRAACPEHAASLPGPPLLLRLLFRHTPEELEAMIATAVRLVGGAREAIAFALKRHAMWKALRPPVAKIGPMAAPQRDGLVAPMPAFAAGGPMPPAGMQLATALEYVAYDELPQAPPAKRKYVRRKPPLPRQPAAAVAVPPAADVAASDAHAGDGEAANGSAAAVNGAAGSSGGEEALGVGRRHKPRKLLYEDAGDYIEEDPFSHKRPRKSNYHDWKGRKPPRLRKLAPFPEPPAQVAVSCAQPTEFVLPQHITQPQAPVSAAADAPSAANGIAAPNGIQAAADAAQQQPQQQDASPSVWAKIIQGLGPGDVPGAAAKAAAATSGGEQPAPAQNGVAHHATASGTPAETGAETATQSAADSAGASCAPAAVLPQPGGAAPSQGAPGAETGQPSADDLMAESQQGGLQALGGGVDAATPMEADDDVAALPEPADAVPAGEAVTAAAASEEPSAARLPSVRPDVSAAAPAHSRPGATSATDSAAETEAGGPANDAAMQDVAEHVVAADADAAAAGAAAGAADLQLADEPPGKSAAADVDMSAGAAAAEAPIHADR